MTPYSVSTTDSDVDTNDTDTTVTVTLLDRTGYTLAESPNHMATVMVTDGIDGLSVINIAPATDGERVSEGSSVEFTFTSNPPLANSVDVMVSLTETGNFLTSAALSTTIVSLDPGATQTESFDVITADGAFDPDSTVTLTLEANDTEYLRGSSRMASVVIEDDSTPAGISVAALEASITEDDANNTHADFQIKADATDTSSRVINIAISQGDADFLSTDTLAIDEVTIGANERSVDLALPIESDTDFEFGGEITVEIADADGSSATYTKASSNTSASIVVNDNDFADGDPADSVGIIAIKSTVSETESAPVQIVAKTVNETEDRTIMVMVANKDSGDFLPAMTYDNAVPVVITANTSYTNLDVMLDDDSKFETNGAITVTIVAEDTSGGGTATYSLGTAFSVEIMVTSEDLEVPVISISSAAETNGVTEGHEFNFTVTSDRTLDGTPLDIEFTAVHRITGATITVADVRIPGDMQTATGMVSLSGVDVASDTDIDIRIDEAVAYDVSATDPSITVAVKDNDTTQVQTHGYQSLQLLVLL